MRDTNPAAERPKLAEGRFLAINQGKYDDLTDPEKDFFVRLHKRKKAGMRFPEPVADNEGYYRVVLELYERRNLATRGADQERHADLKKRMAEGERIPKGDFLFVKKCDQKKNIRQRQTGSCGAGMGVRTIGGGFGPKK